MTKEYIVKTIRFRDRFIDGLLELARAGRLDADAGEMLSRLIQERERTNRPWPTMADSLGELNVELEGFGFPPIKRPAKP